MVQIHKTESRGRQRVARTIKKRRCKRAGPRIETLDNWACLCDWANPWIILLGRWNLRPLLWYRVYPARDVCLWWFSGSTRSFFCGNRNLTRTGLPDRLGFFCQKKGRFRVKRLGNLVRQVSLCSRDILGNPNLLRLLLWYLRPVWALWNNGNVLHFLRPL
jgi:hypothetical protein